MPIFIDHKKKNIFVTSYKCAFSTLFSLFKKHYGLSYSERIFSSKHAEFQDYIYDLTSYTDYKVNTICRNPYKRLVSGFLGRTVPLRPGKITFGDFVKELLLKNDDVHFTNQCNYLLTNAINNNFIDISNLDVIMENEYDEIIYENTTNYDKNNESCMCDATTEDLFMMANYPKYEYFYNSNIICDVNYLYSEDFKYFKNIGIIYMEPNYNKKQYIKA